MEYVRRIMDDEIDRRSKAFNAINIVGPKGCGKTRTALERCNSTIEFQDEEKREGYIAVAETAPHLLFSNKKPILFDEWQDAPKLWGAIRKDCDDHPEAVGEYYLTSNTSNVVTPHTGTGRISKLTLYPMTLYETGESNGKVSLSALFEKPDQPLDGSTSKLSLEDLFFAACRGGWPHCLAFEDNQAKLEVAKDHYRQIYQKDISAVDGVQRNAEWTRSLLWSYARNMATPVKKKTIYSSVKASFNVSDTTLSTYISVLEDLFVLHGIDAWMPQIRSKTAIRGAKKHIFVDPSIGIAALGLSPSYFNNDLDLFGHVFENLVLRDLLAFSQAHDAQVKHYRDDTGLEADAVYQLADGRYALIEIKVGMNKVREAEAGLLRFKNLILNHNLDATKNKEHPKPIYREPSLLIVICGNAPIAYTTENGVHVIPIGCLKD